MEAFITDVQTVLPKLKRVAVNQYTPEGGASIHKNLREIDIDVLYYLMRNPVPEQSMEYNDNRISRFCVQYEKSTCITQSTILIKKEIFKTAFKTAVIGCGRTTNDLHAPVLEKPRNLK